MLRVFLLCCIALFLNGCIQIGNYSIPLEPVYSSGSQKKQHTQQGKSRFSEEDLNSYRKSGSYYKTINTQRNSHLPKGKPYTVHGKKYTPYTSAVGFEEIGIASWYGPGFHGKKTSNGETFNTYSMTAAHKFLPFNTNILVTNLENGKTCVVRINDRGPFVDDRIIDLSQAAAQKIGMIKSGTAKVHLEYLDGDGKNSANTASTAKKSSGGIFGALFGGNNSMEERVVYSDEDKSVSAALASLAGGSMAAGGAGYTSNLSMAEVNPVYVNTAKASGSGSKLFVHLAVFKEKTMADKLVRELQKRNIPAKIYTDSGFYTVHAGPFKNEEMAKKVQQYLIKNFPKSYLVIR